MRRLRGFNLISVANRGLALILVLVPFHAFLTIWVASVAGNYELWRVWKELVLLALVPVVAVLLWRKRAYWRELDTRWLFWATVGYMVLNIGLGVFAYAKGQVTTYALAYALLINLRFLLMFWLCLIVAAQSDWLKRRWRKLVLIPAAVVVGFGLLQFFVLPIDFLRGFGYGPETIMPYGTVDQKLDYARVQSFLRGANPLGAYMIIVLAAAVAGLRSFTPVSRRIFMQAALVIGSLFILGVTYSRAAYIGAAITVMALVLWALRKYINPRNLAIGLIAVGVVAAGVLLTLRNNDHFQNVFFHTDENSLSRASSNEARTAALGRAAGEVVREPFGRGPGTAGPASAHNLSPARISEDYYLQIGQETGWLGLLLFAAINIMVALKLWQRRHDRLARVLLASLIGISVVNLISHAWADDTLSLLWWGLAGIALAPAVLPRPKN